MHSTDDYTFFVQLDYHAFIFKLTKKRIGSQQYFSLRGGWFVSFTKSFSREKDL